MTRTPIKRSKNLVALSKDHHEGLLVVWKIRQGQRYSIIGKRISDFVVYAVNQHLEPHFIDEEELVFSKLPDDDLLMRAKEQHALIRKMVAELRTDLEPSATRLEAFANLLEEHIRFEERVLFPHVEKQLPNEILDFIGKELELTHSKQEPLYWQDEFWLKK